MEIKQKFEMLVATSEKYIIRKSSSHKKITCAKCGERMLTAEQTAVFFGIKQRRIFQIIELGAAHFAEYESGALMICINSLATVLDIDERK
ncbi:MAG TPA: hypothetical protein PKE69_20190 [Pyrinomonadaceae bacterium]|nr:hypothetical protein [Pyrinomonadaceae bacterium]